MVGIFYLYFIFCIFRTFSCYLYETDVFKFKQETAFNIYHVGDLAGELVPCERKQLSARGLKSFPLVVVVIRRVRHFSPTEPNRLVKTTQNILLSLLLSESVVHIMSTRNVQNVPKFKYIFFFNWKPIYLTFWVEALVKNEWCF